MWRNTFLLCSAALVLAVLTPAPRADGADPPVTGVGVGKDATTQPALDLTDRPRSTDKGKPSAAMDANAIANDPDVKLLVKGLNEFAIDLYKEIAKTEKGNIFLSPFSISSALAMTYAGARGKTADEMAKVLHFPPELLKDDAKRLHAAFGKLNAHLNAEKTPDGKPLKYELVTANALWGQVGYPFLEGFIRTNRESYGGRIDLLDFRSDKHGAVGKINSWVAEQTRRKIPDIVNLESLNKDTRLFLANAVYFKGAWEEPFDKRVSGEGGFHLSSKEDVKVTFMRRRGNAGYDLLRIPSGSGSPGDAEAQVLELRYLGGDVSMVVFLPREANSLPDLEAGLSSRVFDFRWPTVELRISFPKYKQERLVKLTETLGRMGMQTPFKDGTADFSGMDGGKRLFISDVVHKAFIEVNEEGTEAAGASMATLSTRGQRPVFEADHPFFLAIRHLSTGCILFAGRVVDPR